MGLFWVGSVVGQWESALGPWVVHLGVCLRVQQAILGQSSGSPLLQFASRIMTLEKDESLKLESSVS